MEKQQRLIDGDALKRWLEMNKANANPLDYNTKATYAECIMMVETMETIDAVPVVRCKECRFRGNPMNCPMCHEEDYYDEDDGFDYIVRDETVDEGYCQKGEREEYNE